MTSNNDCGSGNGYPSDCDITRGLLKKAAEKSAKDPRGYVWKSSLPKAEPVKLLLLDVDGVLTDGTLLFTDHGTEFKGFNSKDGFGIRLLQEAGVQVGIITARQSDAVAKRAENLKLSHVYQGSGNKIEVFEKILRENELTARQVAYMGDDWLDFKLLRAAGFAAAPADAVREVRNIVDYVTTVPGGRGAVREVCELIVEAKGKFESFLERYLNS